MFSVEIFEIICIFLHGDTETLRTCSLVSHTFAALSQKHLFNTIVLRPLHDHPHSTITLAIKFHQALQLAPHLATLVQHLEIALGSALDPRSPFLGLTNNDIALASVLPLLTNLHWLTFEGDGQYTGTQWGSIPLALQESLISSMGLPCLTRLKLSRVRDFPLASTRFSPSLVHMDLDYVTFPRATLSAPPDYDGLDVRPKLNTLTIESGVIEFPLLVEILTHHSCPMPTSCLRSISVFRYLNSCHHIVQTLLNHVSSSLEELVLFPRFVRNTGWYSPPAVIPTIQFRVLSHLRSLKMIIPIRRDGSSLPGAIELLGDLASSDVKEIIMQCDCDSDPVDVQAQWTLVDHASTMLGNIQSVSLQFRSTAAFPTNGALESFVLTTEASLPLLRQKGILRIEYI